MKTGTATIKSLIAQVSEGSLRLPEIQRAYVWKPTQIAGLLDSLYRRYPSGSILLWQTTETVTEKTMSTVTGGGAMFVTTPSYLLDGQQRLTSLHRVFSGHPQAQVVFNVATEKFQIESAATKKDRRWVKVRDLLTGEVDTFTLVEELAPSVPDLTRSELNQRLVRVGQITNYPYYLEILDDMPYAEVTEVFVRVNSRGRALKETDLALATLSARWPGVVGRVDKIVDECRAKRYHALDSSFIVRAFAALAIDTTSPGGFAHASTDVLEAAWTRLERGVQHTINLLVAELGLDNSTLLPSANALVPIVYYLGTRAQSPLSGDERQSLVYWLLIAAIQARYSQSAATVIAQDVGALKTEKPFGALYGNLGVRQARLEVTPSSLVGKGSTSPFFFLSYLAVRRRSARDWWYGTPVALSHDETYKVEFHHIHPRAKLRDDYSKAEINELANLAFISDKANRKIAARPPAAYFAELEQIDSTFLDGHLVPTAPELRSVEAFPRLLAARRTLLAEAINELLDTFRPAFLNEVASTRLDSEPTTIVLQAAGDPAEPDDVLLSLSATAHGYTTVEVVRLQGLLSLLSDLLDGRGGELEVGLQSASFDSGTDYVALPVGPLLVGGSIVDWQKVIARELAELVPLADLPIATDTMWDGPRVDFSVLDSE